MRDAGEPLGVVRSAGALLAVNVTRTAPASAAISGAGVSIATMRPPSMTAIAVAEPLGLIHEVRDEDDGRAARRGSPR